MINVIDSEQTIAMVLVLKIYDLRALSSACCWLLSMRVFIARPGKAKLFFEGL